VRKNPSQVDEIIIGRGSPDFVRPRNICPNPLIDRDAACSLVFVTHRLGELLRIGSRSSLLRVPTVLDQDSQGFPNGRQTFPTAPSLSPMHTSGGILWIVGESDGGLN